MHRTQITSAVLTVVLTLITAPLHAATIYETADPFGGPFGLWGADVFASQSVALRFTPAQAYKLEQVGVWFMSNDFNGSNPADVTLSLRDSVPLEDGTIPGDVVYETWTFTVSAVGWSPVLETVDSQTYPLLQAGTPYWIVAESAAPSDNGVWNFAGSGLGCWTNTDFDGNWYPGGTGAALGAQISGRRAGDIDGNGSIDDSDLGLLLSGFGACTQDPAYDPFADIDASGCIDDADLGILLASFGT